MEKKQQDRKEDERRRREQAKWWEDIYVGFLHFWTMTNSFVCFYNRQVWETTLPLGVC